MPTPPHEDVSIQNDSLSRNARNRPSGRNPFFSPRTATELILLLLKSSNCASGSESMVGGVGRLGTEPSQNFEGGVTGDSGVSFNHSSKSYIFKI